MDEQRVQAYLSLIQELLNSPGEANQILSGHLELVDEGFVQVCQLVAAQLQQAGQDNPAQFLRDVVQEVGQYLNSQTSAVATGEGQTQGTEQDYLNFLMQVLQLTSDSGGNASIIYNFLEQNLDKIKIDFAQTLQRWAVQVLTRFKDEENLKIAGVIGAFSNLIQDFPIGNRKNNLEIAIVGYEAILSFLQKKGHTELWIMTQTRLGNAYSERIEGDQSENIERAIDCYKTALIFSKEKSSTQQLVNLNNFLGCCYSNRIQGEKSNNTEQAIMYFQDALQICSRDQLPEDWAMIQNNLGLVYRDRLQGEQSENVEEAIICYQAALDIFTCQAFPEKWAVQQNNLGLAYSNRIQGERRENLEQAIAYYEAALEVYTFSAYPEQWAMTQNNLGLAYSNRIQGERRENLERAIAYYETALEIYTHSAYPERWTATQNNLGLVYSERIQGERRENLEQAIAYYEAALEVYTFSAYPEQWAMTQNNLGLAYSNRIQGERRENLEQAIAYYEAALEVYTFSAYPKQWAMTQHNLGLAYFNRIQGERRENLEQAISYYEAALEVYTRSAYPEQWAETQNNLGNTYLYRIRGKRGENLEQARAYYEAALEVRTCSGYPERWAATQNNLAAVYNHRIRGKKAENLERAITYNEGALQVYTRSAYPEQWAATNNNLAVAYLSRIRGERFDNLEQAIIYAEATLEVYTPSTYPEEWARTQSNLANIYCERIRGEQTENLERAIAYNEAALNVYTRSAYPEQWATTKNNLGIAYLSRLRGERDENLEKAISCCNAALEVLTRETFPKSWADTQNNLGNSYLTHIDGEQVENLERAIGCYEAALGVYTRSDYPYEWAMSQINLGQAYSNRIRGERAENLERAIVCSEAALEIYTRTAFPQQHTKTLALLGLAYQKQSQHYTHDPEKKQTALQNAYSTFEQALDAVEYLRGEITSSDEAKRKLNEYWTGLYICMVEVCLELGRYTDAIEYVDRSKARNLTELIATRDAYPGGEISFEVRQRLQKLRQAISEEDRRLKQDPNPDYTHISQLREEFQAKYPYKPLKFSGLQSLLDDETVILEWYVLNDKFLTFTLTNHSLNLWKSSEEDLDNLIDWTNAYLNDYRNNKTQWHNNLPQRLETLAQILHLDEILHNLREKFPNCKKLILIPHRFLHLFPLHALPVPVIATDGVGAQCLRPISRQNGNQEGLHIAPLQELFPKGVAYAPNCQVLQQAQKRINQRPDFNQLFAIQNPTQDLDFTDIEVAAIQSLFNPHHILQYDAAEKAAILDGDNLKNAHCTHFSCHGYFNFEDALKSALLLAKSEFTPPPPSEDQSRYIPLQNGNLLDLGKCLTIEDILRLDLRNCRLVTLSACETGITDFNSTSDEYIGLPSGFILAGSPNVVCSLWAVNDLSTALLMIRFYQNVKNGETVPLALKQAQIWLRDVTVEGLQVWSEPILAILDPFSQEDLRCRLSKMDLRSKPFASPYYWAGFCAIGV
jgi:CHAT domain-containing protein